MPSLHSESHAEKSKSADSAHMIIRRLVEKNPRAGESKIVRMFREHMLDEDNYDDLIACLDTTGAYQYRAIVGAAVAPLTETAKRKKAAEGAVRKAETEIIRGRITAAVKTAYAEDILEKAVDLAMTLTHKQALALGGQYTKIGRAGKPNALVSTTLRRSQVKRMIAASKA